MNPEENQVGNPQDMSPDEMAASLAFSTMLSENMLKSANPMQEMGENTEEMPMGDMEEGAEEPMEEKESFDGEAFKEEMRGELEVFKEDLLNGMRDMFEEMMNRE